MKAIFYLTTLLLFTFCTSTMQAQQWQTPVIKGYGKVVDYPDAANQPNPEKDYKILFHITTDKEKEGVNLKLWKIARLINLMGLQNVPKENVHIVAVISGLATPIVLSDKAYHKKLRKPNPNMDLIKRLNEYGVKIEVCGQSLAEREINPRTDLNTFTIITLSAMIDIPTYQMKGYILMP